MLTTVVAVLGAVLGIINTWHLLSRNRLRLRVSPRGWMNTAGASGLCIEVVNLSDFPVTIVAVGVLMPENRQWIFHTLPQGKSCPHRIEPRDSATFYAPPGAEHDPQLAKGRHAFARTACGRIRTGNSPYLRSIFAACAKIKWPAPEAG